MTQTFVQARKLTSSFEPISELVSESLSLAEEVSFRGKVIDTVTLYKLLADMSHDLSGQSLIRCHSVAVEIEETLKHFVKHMVLRERKLSVSSILK